MRSNLILLVFGILIIGSCSKEPLNDPIIESVEMEIDAIKAKLPKDEFKIELIGQGIFEESEEMTCRVPGEYALKVMIHEDILGELSTIMKYCTDFDEIFKIKGIFKDKFGNSMEFYSTEHRDADMGHWYLIEIGSGTGAFEDLVGTARIHVDMGSEKPKEGKFSLMGNGSMSFIR